ncbi:GNAT family N-acetyltransferase [Agreia sp. VKM Ac-1783]|uniref:GNAT family N-acetyltransferase n=1 Tax=Agreia sp. VKM Ac-1783 TaxID=1938889 RepID=UPI000A2AB411|nr:GNAT family N-acetyltransferase [Agreia sp. VKM Ac-1783]SMQ74831.1 N-acetylglutamate synthase, GNAT family [Agreia sp. VKM Ac-1783]
MELEQVSPSDTGSIREFLRAADLTLAGLDAPGVHLWVARDERGRIVGSTGFELSADGRHALIRSVAVDPQQRSAGSGSRLARFAMDAARQRGVERAWLFSRRSGPFWQKLGFTGADRGELASALADTHQVRLFVETGQLDREVAWSCLLTS